MSHSATKTRREQGSSTVTAAIIFPAVGLLFLTLAQAVMVSIARDIAQSAAEEGLRVARARHGTPAGGHNAALDFARREPVLQSPTATVSGSTAIAVRVTGRAPSILPGVHIAVDRTARGARERFTTEETGPT